MVLDRSRGVVGLGRKVELVSGRNYLNYYCKGVFFRVVREFFLWIDKKGVIKKEKIIYDFKRGGFV